MKVLFFGDTPHRVAGAQKSLLAALSRISEYGIEPLVVFPFDHLYPRLCREAGLDVRILPGPPSYHVFNQGLRRLSRLEQLRLVPRDLYPYSRELARFAEREGAPVLHFNSERGIILGGGAAHLARAGSVMHLRGAPWGRAAHALAQVVTDRFVVVSRALLSELTPTARARATVVYNGVNIPSLEPRPAARAKLVDWLAKRDIHVSDTTLLAVTLSSVAPHKGLHHLARAAQIARARGLELAVMCAGPRVPGAYDTWLAGELASRGLDGVFHLLGFVEGIEPLLAGADMFVLPSVESETLRMGEETLSVRGHEGLPRAILESLAHGLPVIASRVTGVLEQLEDGRTGRVVPPSDPAALAEALVELGSNPSLRGAWGAAGLETVRSRFTIANAAQGLARVLEAAARAPETDGGLGRLLPRTSQVVLEQALPKAAVDTSASERVPNTRVRPSALRIESSAHCQLRCPGCHTTQGLVSLGIGKGWLRARDFALMLDSAPFIREVELSNWGEMFLNPELVQILEHARARDVACTADNGVNLNHARAEALEAVVRCGMRSLVVSIDGASQESYAQYRVRGRLSHVLENVRTINRHKARYGTDLPRLTWKFILFGHNEHEVEQARQIARSLDMRFVVAMQSEDEVSPVRDRERARSLLGWVDAKTYREERGEDARAGICTQLWLKPQIHYDGAVLGCCYNSWRPFEGNAVREGVERALNGDGIQRARAMLMGKLPPDPAVPCATCDVYAWRAERGAWVTRAELVAHGRLRQLGRKLLRTAAGGRVDAGAVRAKLALLQRAFASSR
ncbi:MAG: glycosyltransferase [Polyangiaceae bacterium]